MKQSGTLKTRPTEKPHRQVSKPLMERRRRARINGCLGELRSLLQQSHIPQSCRSKLEKADILELTVSHLKALTQRIGSGSFAEVAMSRFYAGYSDCAREVSSFLSTSTGITNAVRGSLLHRLSDRATALTSGAALPNHPPETPAYRFYFERSPGFSSPGPTVPDACLPMSPQSVGGQPAILPVANSAFSFLLNPCHEPPLVPGVSTRLAQVHTVLESKVHTANSCTGETVWRPW